jgi:hypothetical protein
MADVQGLDVHDTQVSEVTRYDAQGRPVRFTVVTYSIGNHGPYTMEYAADQATPDRVNADMDKRIAALRAIRGTVSQ